MSGGGYEHEHDDGTHRMRVAERYKTNAKYRKLIKILSTVQVTYICLRTFWNLIPVVLGCTYALFTHISIIKELPFEKTSLLYPPEGHQIKNTL